MGRIWRTGKSWRKMKMRMGLRNDDAEEGQYACEEKEGVGDNDTKQPYKGFGGSFAQGTSRKHLRSNFG